jgi:hypothetical protein
MPIQYPQFDAKKGYPKDENFFFLFKRKADKRLLIKSGMDYGHTMAKSLILFGPNSNPNPK